ncbi:lipopolysaccharide biosynthesis protein [Persicobacter psychrovividus]|uniref:Na+-driven multidrug efflux pump n=1 Tax=Persicobacter psychrovividus TaxID=387638 RepID=A0ABM7VGG4_9BACT|nr:hypothetical protein PEPS_22940 [Persicobacter psychrovividus]
MTDIRQNNRRLAKNAFAMYLRNIITLLVSLYTTRIVLDLLGVEDFGIYNVISGFVTMFSFVSGALSTATSRFLTFEIGRGNHTELRTVYQTAFTILLIIAVIVVLLLESVGGWFITHKMVIPAERLYAARIVFHFSVFTAFITLLQVPLTALIISHERMQAFALIGVSNVFVKLLTVFSLYFIPYDKLIVFSVFSMVNALLLMFLCHQYCRGRFTEYQNSLLFDRTIFYKMMSFSGWSFIGSFANITKMQGVNVLLNLFYGPAVNAARGIALQVNLALSQFTQSVSSSFSPQIIKYYSVGEKNRVLDLVCKGSIYSFVLLLFLSLPILFSTEFILSVWLKSVPKYTIWFCRLIIINSLIDVFSFYLGDVVRATGEIKRYQIAVGVIVLFNLPVSYIILSKGFSPLYTVIVSIMLSVFSLGVRCYLLKQQENRFSISEYFMKVIGKALALSLISISFLFVLTLFDLSGWEGLIKVSAGTLFIVPMVSWKLVFTGEDRQKINSLLKKKIYEKVF